MDHTLSLARLRDRKGSYLNGALRLYHFCLLGGSNVIKWKDLVR